MKVETVPNIGPKGGFSLVELLVSMVILAVGLTATATALLRIQQSVQIAFHQSQGLHILNELLMQVSTVNSANNPGIGFSVTQNVPLVDNFFNRAGAGTFTTNPRMDAGSGGLTCTSANTTVQNCLFKFFNTQTNQSENIINGNNALGTCPVGGPINTTCYDPDRLDQDTTRYRISWAITNRADSAGIGGNVQTYNACEGATPGQNILARQVTLTVQWQERGQTYTKSQPLFLGC
ncbi:MAG: prepilin-type N-terminal cleavage/methylation domain-containing protein [Nitrospirae bacterium]|nr:prepilin-type N-terminal cleavage/methylation domain-containing protein [Nitrospirota bacterium]